MIGMIDLLNKEQQWFNDDKKFSMVLTDDIDSLFSCALLEKYKGWEIGHFYDFSKMYELENNNGNEKVYIDMAVLKGKAIDNHVTMKSNRDYYNKESINLNLIEGVTCNNYEEKYSGSTLLEVISLLGIDISEWTEEQMMFILCVDKAYLGYYDRDGYYREAHKKYMHMMGFDCLIELEEKKTMQDFKFIEEWYGICQDKQISVRNGKLRTNLNLRAINSLFKDLGIVLTLPEGGLTVETEYGKVNKGTYNGMINGYITLEVFTLAFTYKGKAMYTPYLNIV